MEKLKNEELLKLAREGNGEAFECFFNRNHKFCNHIALRFSNYLEYTEMGDLVGVAYYSLMKAYKTYNLESETKFLTYANIIISNDIMDYGQKLKRQPYMSSLDREFINDIEDEISTLYHIIFCDDYSPEKIVVESIYLKEMIEIMSEEVSKLSNIDKLILKGIYHDNKKQYEIAEEIGIDPSVVSRKHSQILKHLRNNMYIYIYN